MMLYPWFMLLWSAFFVKGAPSASSGGSLNPNELINLDLVKHINAFITLDSLITNLIRRVHAGFSSDSLYYAQQTHVF